MKRSEAKFYRGELEEAVTTESLLGESKSMERIELGDERIKSYVAKRISASGKEGIYVSENELFEKFWYRGGVSEQILFVEGVPGIGKSTFLNYFFRYFLPHKPHFSSPQPTELQCSIHANSWRRHLILYADMRRPDPGALRASLFHHLRESVEDLHHRGHPLAAGQKAGSSDEEWVKKCVLTLAREREGNRRKWFVSWIIDNVDQMEQKDQIDLLRVVSDYIRQERGTGDWATSPVKSLHDALWRVIIPVRPETQLNFNLKMTPWPNKELIRLDPVHPQMLIETRADRLRKEISKGGREYTWDLQPKPRVRPYYGSQTADESATSLSSDLVAGHNLEGHDPATTAEAKSIFDDLVNNSTRRRLEMASRAAMSPSFRARRRMAAEEKWGRTRVSTFYFLDGLIRGDNQTFDIADPYILNLYDMGANPGSAHSVFVGLHAIVLLNRNSTWSSARETLKKIGYEENDLESCEDLLRSKELIKPLWDKESRFLTDQHIVKGHWSLLKQRAYTDNMAVACGLRWGEARSAPATDPLESEQLLSRINASLWFMQTIAKLENQVLRFSTAARSRGTERHDFIKAFNEQKFPSITAYIAKEYQTEAKKFPSYERTYAAIDTNIEVWNRFQTELERLVQEAEANNPVRAQG